MSDTPLDSLASEIATRLLQRKERLAVAESCTGGLIAKVLTDWPGSSVWFERGLVTYSNEAKAELLGVTQQTLSTHGSVSGPTVLEMANGLLLRAPVEWTLAVSGIAGPGGGTEDKPVGTVWLAWAGRQVSAGATRCRFDGDRAQVRYQSAFAALEGLLQLLRPSVG